VHVLVERLEAGDAPLRAVDGGVALGVVDIALHPGAVVVGLAQHVVLGLAGFDATAAADALVDLDAHAVGLRRRRGTPLRAFFGQHLQRPASGGQDERARELRHLEQELSAFALVSHRLALR